MLWLAMSPHRKKVLDSKPTWRRAGRGLSVPNLDFLSRYSTFLPQPKGMHDILVISDCKLAVAANVSMTVYSACQPYTAGVGSSPLLTCKKKKMDGYRDKLKRES